MNGNGAFDGSFIGASSDGSKVFFSTDEQLVSGDTDSSQDVYERSGGTTTQVSQGQINGNGAFAATFTGASSDGSKVFFTTDEQLVSGDTDSSSDSTSAPAGRRPRSPRARSTATAPSGRLHRRLERRLEGLLQTDEQLVSGDTDSARDVYERSGGDHDPGLPGPDQRQRRLRRLLRRRLERRLEGLLPHRRAAGQRRHRQLTTTSTSAPGERRPRSPRARSTATAPSTPTSSAPRATARRSSSGPTSRWSAATPMANSDYLRDARTGDDEAGLGRGDSARDDDHNRARGQNATTPPRPSPSPPRRPARASSASSTRVPTRPAAPPRPPRTSRTGPTPSRSAPRTRPATSTRPQPRAPFTVKTAAISVSGSTLVVTAAPGAKDNLRITRPSASTLRVTDLAAGAYTGSGVHAGAGCTRSGDYTANCNASGITLIQVTCRRPDRQGRQLDRGQELAQRRGGERRLDRRLCQRHPDRGDGRRRLQRDERERSALRPATWPPTRRSTAAAGPPTRPTSTCSPRTPTPRSRAARPRRGTEGAYSSADGRGWFRTSDLSRVKRWSLRHGWASLCAPGYARMCVDVRRCAR